jgi:hypothetical protein
MDTKALTNAVAPPTPAPAPAPVAAPVLVDASAMYIPLYGLTPTQRRVMQAVEGLGLESVPGAAIAGGAALAFLNDTWAPRDVDVFLTGASAKLALLGIVEKLACMKEPVYFCATARSVLSVFRRGRLPVQLVLSDHASVLELVAEFDLNVCRAVVSFTPTHAEVMRFASDPATYAPGAPLVVLPSLVKPDGTLPERARARAVKYALGGGFKIEPAAGRAEVHAARVARGKTVEWYGDMNEDAFRVQMEFIGGLDIDAGACFRKNGEGMTQAGAPVPSPLTLALRAMAPMAPGVDLAAAYAGPHGSRFQALYEVRAPSAVGSLEAALEKALHKFRLSASV